MIILLGEVVISVCTTTSQYEQLSGYWLGLMPERRIFGGMDQ